MPKCEGNLQYKICRICKREKPIDAFRIRDTKTGLRRSECIECKKQINHNYHKTHRIPYADLTLDKKEINRARVIDNTERKIMEALRMYDYTCSMCGENNLLLLQWHHRKGRHRKNENMDAACRMIARAGTRLDDIVLLCSNCHILADVQDKTGKRSTRMARIIVRLKETQNDKMA